MLIFSAAPPKKEGYNRYIGCEEMNELDFEYSTNLDVLGFEFGVFLLTCVSSAFPLFFLVSLCRVFACKIDMSYGKNAMDCGDMTGRRLPLQRRSGRDKYTLKIKRCKWGAD